MIKLYHCVNARSFRALWALEEMQLAYELRVLSFPPRVVEPDFLAINPLGTIPALFDGATVLTESAAIIQYLAVRHGPAPIAVEPDDAAYGAWLNWLHFGEATLTFPQTLILRYQRFEPEDRRKPEIVADYTRWFLSRLRHVERALATSEYLCAGRFTGADISVGYALLLADRLGLAQYFPPLVSAYWQRLQARPFYRTAQYEQMKTGVESSV